MACPTTKKSRLSPTMMVACLALIVIGVLTVFGLLRAGRATPDVMVTESICSQLLENTTAGRQALVSSIWWPPLPVLVRLPLVALFGRAVMPTASIIISAAFGVGVILLLFRMLSHWHLGPLRFLLMAGLILNPMFLEHCLNGSSATTITYLALLTTYGLVEWTATARLRHLMYFAFGAALMVLTSFEMSIWLLILFLLLIVDQVHSKTERQRKEAVLILGLLPALYTACLWVLMNWLIMGDGFYFLRPLIAATRRGSSFLTGNLVLHRVHYAAVICTLPGFVLGLVLRRRSPVYAAVACGGLLVVSLFLTANNLLWSPAPLFSVLMLLSLVVVALTVRLLRVISRPAAFVAALLPLGLVFAMGVDGGSWQQSSAETLADVIEEQRTLRNSIRGHVVSRSPYAKVFVSGYDSFNLLGTDSRDTFVHALDFNFNQANEDYHGHRLFMLIHSPVGRSAMDSIHWHYPDIHMFGHRNTLYDGEWGAWRLFEMIEAPR